MRFLLLALLMQLDAPLDDCPELHSTCLESCRVDFGMERERKKLTACVETCEAKQAGCERGKAQDLDELRRAREALAQPDKSASPAEVKRIGGAAPAPAPAEAATPTPPPEPAPEPSRGPVKVEIMRDPPPSDAPVVVPARAEPAPAAEQQRKQSIDDAFDQEPAPAPAPAKAPAAKKK